MRDIKGEFCVCVGTTWTHVTIVCECTSGTCHLRWSMYHYSKKKLKTKRKKLILQIAKLNWRVIQKTCGWFNYF